MLSPLTVMFTAGSGCFAGPLFTLPSSIEKLLLWQGQLMTPFAMLLTAQPWWVQTAENAL